MIRPILFCLILSVAAACSGHKDNFPDRPVPGGEADEAAAADPSMRIDCDALHLSYNDGGIIFQRSTDGVISGVRLSDGASFDYDPSAPELRINGVVMELSEAKTLKREGTTEWHRLTSRKGDKIYIVVTDL